MAKLIAHETWGEVLVSHTILDQRGVKFNRQVLIKQLIAGRIYAVYENATNIYLSTHFDNEFDAFVNLVQWFVDYPNTAKDNRIDCDLLLQTLKEL